MCVAGYVYPCVCGRLKGLILAAISESLSVNLKLGFHTNCVSGSVGHETTFG